MRSLRPSYRVGELIAGTRYRFVEALGEGGQGVVWRVEHDYLQVPCVMKLVHPELVDVEEIAQRAAREARTLAKLRHPNIVRVTDGGMTEEPTPRPFFVMEELNGVSFRDALRKLGPGVGVGPVAALDLIAGVLEGLRYAHAAGVVHRDIKPENLFIHRTDSGSVPKILDFGIAHLTRGGRRVTGQCFIGTPRYSSPEQIRGETPTERSDLYAVGLVLSELLTGKLPYAHIAPRDMAALCAAHLLEPLPMLATKGADVPPLIASIVEWLVKKDLSDRCPNAFAALAGVREARARIDDTITGAIHRADFQTQPTPMENLLLTETRTEDPTVVELSEPARVPSSSHDTTPDGPPIFDAKPSAAAVAAVAAAQVRSTTEPVRRPVRRLGAGIDRNAETAVRPVAPLVRRRSKYDTEPIPTPIELAQTTPSDLPRAVSGSNESSRTPTTTAPSISANMRTTLERRPVVRGLVFVATASALALVLLPVVLRQGRPARDRVGAAPVASAPSPSPTTAAAASAASAAPATAGPSANAASPTNAGPVAIADTAAPERPMPVLPQTSASVPASSPRPAPMPSADSANAPVSSSARPASRRPAPPASSRLDVIPFE